MGVPDDITFTIGTNVGYTLERAAAGLMRGYEVSAIRRESGEVVVSAQYLRHNGGASTDVPRFVFRVSPSLNNIVVPAGQVIDIDDLTSRLEAAVISATERLFRGGTPEGIAWADRETKEDGDYRHLAFLSYRTLELEIAAGCPDDLKAEIEAEAAAIQARQGDEYQVTTSGQTVTLGWGLSTGPRR